MSVLIKNVEMPNSCADCSCASIFAGYKCMACDRQFDRYPLENRMDWCPLVPIPSHGRLIDADALDVIGYRDIPQGREDTFDDGVMWLAEQIDLLPTIIPAEEGE